MKKLHLFISLLVYSFTFCQGINVVEYDFTLLGLKNVKAFAVADDTESYFFFSQDKSMIFEKLNEKDDRINPSYVFKYNLLDDYFLQTMNNFQKKG